DALIPAVLASVVAYSVVITIFGELTLFGRPARYPFHPGQLPLYALMTILVALLAVAFVRTLHFVEHGMAKLRGPAWMRPAIGAFLLGLCAVPVIVYMGWKTGTPGQGLGL